MHTRSTLSASQRDVAVAMFEVGHGRRTVATHLGVSHDAVRKLYDRWRIRGREALVAKSTKRVFTFEFKLALVQRFLAGETKVALAQEFNLSSPEVVGAWARIYRREGEAGLRPKPKGRPRIDPAAPTQELSELEQLRQENLRLRAEVAYLGKLQALMASKRR